MSLDFGRRAIVRRPGRPPVVSGFGGSIAPGVPGRPAARSRWLPRSPADVVAADGVTADGVTGAVVAGGGGGGGGGAADVVTADVVTADVVTAAGGTDSGSLPLGQGRTQ